MDSISKKISFLKKKAGDLELLLRRCTNDKKYFSLEEQLKFINKELKNLTNG